MTLKGSSPLASLFCPLLSKRAKTTTAKYEKNEETDKDANQGIVEPRCIEWFDHRVIFPSLITPLTSLSGSDPVLRSFQLIFPTWLLLLPVLISSILINDLAIRAFASR